MFLGFLHYMCGVCGVCAVCVMFEQVSMMKRERKVRYGFMQGGDTNNKLGTEEMTTWEL